MENKQNDKPNKEETGSPSNQSETKEINPNDLTSNQTKQSKTQENNKHPYEKTNTGLIKIQGEEEKTKKNENTPEREEEIREEEITDGIHGVTKPIKFTKEEKENNTDNLYIKKGGL